MKPFIKVIYEDVRENLTQQNINKVKRYFENKYNSTSVKIIPIVNNKDNKELDIQITTNDNITDKQFQKNLIKTYIEQNKIEVDFNLLDRLDNRVNEKLLETDKDKIKYSSWKIKKIEFSNLLSFGDDNIIDYSALQGITNIESLPRNFGGKCVDENTEIEIEFDIDYIVNKIGFLPDELKKTIKIIDVLNLFNKYDDLNINVNTPYGFKKIEDCQITQKNADVFSVKTENDLFLNCSGNHRIKTKNGRFIEVKDLNIGQLIQTKFGNSPIVSIFKNGEKKDLLDIQVKDVEQYYSNNIVSHNSNLAVDCLMFLFFNKTTKTKTNSELFNKFRDKNEINVKGEIEIDNERFIIERNVTRKLKRNSDYDITSKLDFYTIDENNQVKNLNDEQRRKTEVLITSAIGDEEDFLLTILTTGYNLEELIDSKPTARGNILTKFIGLEILKKKEQICRDIYNDWNKKLLSNNYDINDLKTENENIIINEIELNNNKITLEQDYKNFESEILLLENENESLLKKRKNIDENNLLHFNIDENNNSIRNNELKILEFKNSLSNINILEPKEYYLESEHNLVIKEILGLNQLIFENNQYIRIEEKLINQLEHSKFCPTCKREFDGINNDEKIKEINIKISDFKKLLLTYESKLNELNKTKENFESLKRQLDLYEKNKLLKTKYELEIEQKENVIINIKLKIDSYESNKLAIEENKFIDISLQTNKTKLQTLKGKLKFHIESLEKIKNTLQNSNIKLNQNVEIIKKINAENDLAKIFQVYLSIFGKNGISKLILKNVIPKINEELLELLMDSCNFTVELIINDKNEVEFNMIDNETRISKNLSSGSGFEKTIASLALRSVLTKISTLPKPNIMIMDEVLGKVANENLDLIGEFFLKIKNYFDNIIIITHNPLIKNWSDNNILIVKENNVSKIQ